MDQAKIRIKIISDLLAPYPAKPDADPKTILALYVAAIDGIPDMYVGEAARRMNAGMVKRNNMAFAPTPPEFAAEARRIWHAELGREQRDREARAQISQKPIERIQEDVEARSESYERIMARLRLHTMDEDRPVRFTDLPQAQAEADLAALAAKAGTKRIGVSDELRRSLGLQTDETESAA